jgi:hypothetical protein
MSGAGFILAINMAVAGLLAAAFLMVAVYDKKNDAACWMAFGFALAMSNFGLEFAIASLGTSRPAVVASFAAFLAAMTVFNAGVARKYEVAVPWRLMGVVFIVSIATCYLIQDMPRNSFSRMLLYQLPYFLMQAVGVGIVWSAKSRRPLDNLFMAVMSASALQFLSKAFLFQIFGGHRRDRPGLSENQLRIVLPIDGNCIRDGHRLADARHTGARHLRRRHREIGNRRIVGVAEPGRL